MDQTGTKRTSRAFYWPQLIQVQMGRAVVASLRTVEMQERSLFDAPTWICSILQAARCCASEEGHRKGQQGTTLRNLLSEK